LLVLPQVCGNAALRAQGALELPEEFGQRDV
jgi:hypothetical protein